jgi:hypothetical protein
MWAFIKHDGHEVTVRVDRTVSVASECLILDGVLADERRGWHLSGLRFPVILSGQLRRPGESVQEIRARVGWSGRSCRVWVGSQLALIARDRAFCQCRYAGHEIRAQGGLTWQQLSIDGKLADECHGVIVPKGGSRIVIGTVPGPDGSVRHVRAERSHTCRLRIYVDADVVCEV